MKTVSLASAAMLLLGVGSLAQPALGQYTCPPGFSLAPSGNCVGWPVPDLPTTYAPELYQPPPYAYAPPVAQPPPVVDGFGLGVGLAAIAGILGNAAGQHHGEEHRPPPRARRHGEPERR